MSAELFKLSKDTYLNADKLTEFTFRLDECTKHSTNVQNSSNILANVASRLRPNGTQTDYDSTMFTQVLKVIGDGALEAVKKA